MRSLKIVLPLCISIMLAVLTTGFVISQRALTTEAGSKGFAVIELYTSEGCSSCPPADELVARVQKENAGKPVYILAYHVDYWNRLGWKDQFSSADFSKRQHQYANYLHINSVYTPQIVVNGKAEFVGSEEGTLRKAISNGLAQQPSARLSLNAQSVTKNILTLTYNAAYTGKNEELQLALVQRSAQTRVLAGENGGHTLSHVQIVRSLQSCQLTGSAGMVQVKLPARFDARTWEVTAFIQDKDTGAISAAATAALSTDTDAVASVKASK